MRIWRDYKLWNCLIMLTLYQEECGCYFSHSKLSVETNSFGGWHKITPHEWHAIKHSNQPTSCGWGIDLKCQICY